MTAEPWEDHLLDPDREAPEVIDGRTWGRVLAADLRARDRSTECWVEDLRHRWGLVEIRNDERNGN